MMVRVAWLSLVSGCKNGGEGSGNDLPMRKCVRCVSVAVGVCVRKSTFVMVVREARKCVRCGARVGQCQKTCSRDSGCCRLHRLQISFLVAPMQYACVRMFNSPVRAPRMQPRDV